MTATTFKGVDPLEPPRGSAATTVPRPPRNGVNVPTLFATLNAVKGAPQIAQFQFRATNEWISGTHNR
ncbi:MAG TPA: hypothetical protein VGW74_01005, partial [Propionibacteriaceae bacterium]|nr:hypothetical protein [Propionibacteriaceae bacterium]